MPTNLAPAEGPEGDERAEPAPFTCETVCVVGWTQCSEGSLVRCELDDRGCTRWSEPQPCDARACEDERRCAEPRCDAGMLTWCEKPNALGCESWTTRACPERTCFDAASCLRVEHAQFGGKGRDQARAIAANGHGEVFVGAYFEGELPPDSEQDPGMELFRIGADARAGRQRFAQWGWGRFEDLRSLYAHGADGLGTVIDDHRRYGTTRLRRYAASGTSVGESWSFDGLRAAAGDDESLFFVRHSTDLNRTIDYYVGRRGDEVLWQGYLPDVSSANDVALAPDGGAVLVGYNTEGKIYVAKWSAEGKPIWQHELSSAPSVGYAFVSNPRTGVVHVIHADGSSAHSHDGGGGWILSRIEADGRVASAHPLKLPRTSTPVQLLETPDGGFFVLTRAKGRLGRFWHEPDIEVLKLDAEGGELWRHTTRTWAADEPVGAAVDAQGRLVVAATTDGAMGDTHHGGSDVVVSIYQPLRVLDGTEPAPRTDPPVPLSVQKAFDYVPVWTLPDGAGVVASNATIEDNRVLFIVRIDEVEHLVLPVHVQEAWLENRFEDHRSAITRPVTADRLPESVRAWLNQRFRVVVADGDGQRSFCLATLGNPVAMADEYEDFDMPLSASEIWQTSRRLLVTPLIPVDPVVSCSRAEFAMLAERPVPTILHRANVPLEEVEAAFEHVSRSSAVRRLVPDHRALAKQEGTPYGGPRSFARAERWGSADDGLIALTFFAAYDEHSETFLVTTGSEPSTVYSTSATIAGVLDLEGDGQVELLVYSNWWGPALMVRGAKRWRVESALITHPGDPC